MLHRRNAICALVLGAAAISWQGCTASKTTEIVAGISTQVQVPRDIKTIQIRVGTGGQISNVLCQNYTVYDGKVQLPRTLGALPSSGGQTQVTITVLGFNVPISPPDDDTDNGLIGRGDAFTCNSLLVDDATVGGDPAKIGNGMGSGGARVLRRSRQTYQPDQILFLPVPLKYSCFDVDCSPMGSDKTCKAGHCVDATIPLEKLVTYNDNLIFGGDSTCFQLDNGMGAGCFNDTFTIPPFTVDDDKCIYRVPSAADAQTLGVNLPSLPSSVPIPPDALNVRITYDGGVTKEILDLDADEGFFIPDPTAPQTFQLAPGICDMIHGYNNVQHRVTGIEINPVCHPKLGSQSICAKDQLAIVGANPTDGSVTDPNGSCVTTPLRPQKAVAEFVVDPTTNASDFYTAVASFAQKLADPALQNLSVGVHFMESGALNGTTCPTTKSALTDTTAPLAVVDPMNPTDPKKSPLYQYLAGLVGGDLTMPKAPMLAPAARLNVVSGLEAAYADLAAHTPANASQSIIVVGKNLLTDTKTPDFSLSCLDTAVTPNKSQTPAQVITSHTGAAVSILEIGDPLTANDPCIPGSPLATAVGNDALGVPRCQTTDVKGKNQTQALLANAFIESVACVYQAPAQQPDEVWFNDPVLGKQVVQKGTATTINACRAGGSGFYYDANTLMLCGSDCGRYLTALQEATAAVNATSSTIKLPTIIPLFAMKGDACTPPQMGSGGMSGGVSCGSMTCATGQICCGNGTGNFFCSTTACPSGNDAGSGPPADAGTDGTCNPGTCNGCCNGSVCVPLASENDMQCGNHTSCQNCSSIGRTCDSTGTHQCVMPSCVVSTTTPSDGMGNCGYKDTCIDGDTYSITCFPVGGGNYECDCADTMMRMGNGAVVSGKGDNCAALQTNVSSTVPAFLTGQCGFKTPL